MEISEKTNFFELLEKFPSLEEQIIQATPTFKNLKNPTLRKTIGRLVTVGGVAHVSKLDNQSFVHLIRKIVGQAEISPQFKTKSTDAKLQINSSDPEWVRGEPECIVNGSEILDQGEIPLFTIREKLDLLTPGGFILLITNFAPNPLIESLKKKNRNIYSKRDPENKARYLTFIQ